MPINNFIVSRYISLLKESIFQKNKMKKKENKEHKLLLQALGKGHRESYLEANPHGFSKTLHLSKDKSKYNRKQSKSSHYE